MQLNDRLLKMRNKLWDTRPCITATGVSPTYPNTKRPAWPGAVDRGKPGISA